MSTALELVTQDIYALQPVFEAVAVDRSVNFEREAGFAVQQLAASDYMLKVAQGNRQSVVDAVTNIAAIGISLNPAKKQAYLVPRKSRICLDISYMGLIELAAASGSIRFAKAELVRQADRFHPNGYDRPPVHEYDPFSRDRGPIVGVYCVAKTADGDYLTETMSLDEVYDIRDRSDAWKAWIAKQKSCPWVTDEGEMIKKTAIKRASKTWPKTERLDRAVHHLNTDGGEGIELASPAEAPRVSGFDIDAALSDVAGCRSLDVLEGVWRGRGAQAAAAKDRDGYRSLADAVRARKADLESQPELRG